MRGRQPNARVFGADCTGKSALCDAITAMAPNWTAIGSTEQYVYSWLRTWNIGPSSTITPEQIDIRRQVFLAANRVQVRAVREVTYGLGQEVPGRPLVAVRGRADTIITHSLLKGEQPPRDMARLFPAPNMRPDAIIVLTAPIEVIAGRLAARGQAATGANDLEFLEACQNAYRDLGNFASKRFPVHIFDTSDPHNTPYRIADEFLGRAAA